MEQDYYEILGVSRDADASTIRSAFKRLALTHHPDKVAEAERPEAEVRFKIISEAYETLSNEETRIIYDAEAEFGGPFGAGGAQDWQDFYFADRGEMPEFFDFAADMGSQSHQNPFSGAKFAKGADQRTPDANFTVELNLEDIYYGRMLKLRTKRQILCRRCEGTGGKSKARKHRCHTCRGLGTTTQSHMVGPGLYSNTTVLCSVCRGAGEIFSNRDLCRRCKGRQTQEVSTMIEVYVPKGVKNRHRIVVERQADEEPGKQTGDLVIIVYVSAQHSVFRREGADLYASATITLLEALTGFSRPLITHLDSRQLQPMVPRGQIIQPQSVIKLPGEGLLVEDANGEQAGDLYLQIIVEFPTTLPAYVIDKVARLLTAVPEEVGGDAEASDDTLGNPHDEISSTHDHSDDYIKGSEGARPVDSNGEYSDFPVDDVDNEMIVKIGCEVLQESDLPERQDDANDEPEEEEPQSSRPQSNFGMRIPSTVYPSQGCLVM